MCIDINLIFLIKPLQDKNLNILREREREREEREREREREKTASEMN